VLPVFVCPFLVLNYLPGLAQSFPLSVNQLYVVMQIVQLMHMIGVSGQPGRAVDHSGQHKDGQRSSGNQSRPNMSQDRQRSSRQNRGYAAG
jgi:hypothetical protein